METGAPATERGHRRRIAVMSFLMFALIVGGFVYAWNDISRAEDAEKRQLETKAERGAALYANNCASCHGTRGQGLIGPALNRPENRPEDPVTREKLFATYAKTITCGRAGAVMPAWGQTEDGPLDFYQIEQLATLLTTLPSDGEDAEKYWKLAEEEWLAANPGLTEPPIPTGLVENPGACGQASPLATPAPTGTPAPTATPTGTAPVSNEITLGMGDNFFDPNSFVASSGTPIKVTVNNNGAAIHNFKLLPDGPATEFVMPGGSATIELGPLAPGTYNFLCEIHPTDMTGSFTVE